MSSKVNKEDSDDDANSNEFLTSFDGSDFDEEFEDLELGSDDEAGDDYAADGDGGDVDGVAAASTHYEVTKHVPDLTLREQQRLMDNMLNHGFVYPVDTDSEHLSKHLDMSSDHREVFDYDNRDTLVDLGQEQRSRAPGPGVSYCVFCAHGTSKLTYDNTALLNYFISERGRLLPRRVTNCCAKHQRKVKRVVKRARDLNFLPFMNKLHPKLRFSSMTPDPVSEASRSADRDASESKYLTEALNELRSISSN